jgi:hypothetical protein
MGSEYERGSADHGDEVSLLGLFGACVSMLV